MVWLEFVCADCKALVVRFDGHRGFPPARCHNCDLIRNLGLPPDEEAQMRALLNCELREEADDVCEPNEGAG